MESGFCPFFCWLSQELKFVGNVKFSEDKSNKLNLIIHWLVVQPYHVVNLISLVIRQKGKSQNGCLKKTKHAKFSEKRTFLTHCRTCAYQGVRNVCFSENLACFVFLKHPFWDSHVCLITDNLLAYSLVVY